MERGPVVVGIPRIPMCPIKTIPEMIPNENDTIGKLIGFTYVFYITSFFSSIPWIDYQLIRRP